MTKATGKVAVREMTGFCPRSVREFLRGWARAAFNPDGTVNEAKNPTTPTDTVFDNGQASVRLIKKPTVPLKKLEDGTIVPEDKAHWEIILESGKKIKAYRKAEALDDLSRELAFVFPDDTDFENDDDTVAQVVAPKELDGLLEKITQRKRAAGVSEEEIAKLLKFATGVATGQIKPT